MKNGEIHLRELMLAAKIHEKFPILPNQSVVFIGATDGELQRLFSEVFLVEEKSKSSISNLVLSLLRENYSSYR